MTQTSPATIITFVVYIGGVFLLAALSHRLLSKKSFMSEYFLGSRGLGSWGAGFSPSPPPAHQAAASPAIHR